MRQSNVLLLEVRDDESLCAEVAELLRFLLSERHYTFLPCCSVLQGQYRHGAVVRGCGTCSARFPPMLECKNAAPVVLPVVSAPRDAVVFWGNAVASEKSVVLLPVVRL